MKNNKIIKNILLYIGLALMVSGNVIIQNLSNLDEIWVYNFARGIAEGLLPYKDISMIITPIFPMISAIFLRIFGNEMFVLRILECFETAAILFFIYKIMIRLKINKGVGLLSVISFYFVFIDIFCFDYNWTVLLVALILLYIELKDKEPLLYDLKKDLLLGILTGCTIFCKQTSGIVLAFIFVFYKILNVSNLEDTKKAIKIIGTRLLGVFIPVLLFIIYFSINRNMGRFCRLFNNSE